MDKPKQTLKDAEIITFDHPRWKEYRDQAIVRLTKGKVKPRKVKP